MSTTISTLSVRLTASTAAFTTAMAGAARPLAGLSTRLAGVGTQVAGLATALGAGALVTGTSGLAIYAVKLAADAEQARVAFTTMLGSADAAKSLMADINSFAAATPFQTTELIDASKKLLAFGVAQDQIVPTMRTLGDVAAGLNIPLGELSEIYGKARVQGRLYMEDINQLTGRGIPVIQQFAKQFGVTEAEVRKLVESGKINFANLQQALVSLTGEGGQFSGLMAAQSQTVSGLFSTLQDNVTLSLTRVGETIVEKLDLRGAIAGISESLSALASVGLPILESFIGGLAEGGNVGVRAGEFVLSGAEMIATGIAYALNVVDLLAAGWRGAQAGVAYAIGGMLKAIDFLGQGIVDLLNLVPGVELEWTDTFDQTGDALIDEGNKLAAQAGENLDKAFDGSRTRAVGGFFDQVRANAAAARSATEEVGDAAEKTTLKIEQSTATQSEKVRDMLDKLRQQVAEFDMTDTAKLAADVRAAGGTDADVTEAIKLQGQLDAMEQAKKMQDEAASIFDSTRTPMEKYETTIGKLSELLNAGMLDWDTYGRAVRQAREELEGKSNEPNLQAPDLVMAGSAQAQRFAYDFARGQQKVTDRNEVPREQLAEQRDGNRLLERIARNTETQGTGLEVVDL